MKIDGARLSFVMPPGQRVFLTALSGPTNQNQERSHEQSQDPVDGQQESSTTETDSREHSHTGVITEAGSSNKRKSEFKHGDCKRPCSQPLGPNDQVASSTEYTENTTDVAAEIVSSSTCAEAVSPTEGADGSAETSDKPENGAEASDSPSRSVPEPIQESTKVSTPTKNTGDSTDEILVENLRGLTALSTKIREIDGRIAKCPNGNAWKEFRAYRNNQDMGSLWEVRQAWFQRKK